MLIIARVKQEHELLQVETFGQEHMRVNENIAQVSGQTILKGDWSSNSDISVSRWEHMRVKLPNKNGSCQEFKRFQLTWKRTRIGGQKEWNLTRIKRKLSLFLMKMWVDSKSLNIHQTRWEQPATPIQIWTGFCFVWLSCSGKHCSCITFIYVCNSGT